MCAFVRTNAMWTGEDISRVWVCLKNGKTKKDDEVPRVDLDNGRVFCFWKIFENCYTFQRLVIV